MSDGRVPGRAAATSAPFSATLLDALLTFAANNAAARPQAVYLRPGDIVWRLPLRRLAGLGQFDCLRLWFDADGVAGYAWFEPPTGAEVDLRADLDWHGDVGTAMLEWSEQMRLQSRAAYPWLVGIEDMAEWAAAVRRPNPTQRHGHWLTIQADEADDGRVAALRRRGFTPTSHHDVTYGRDLTQPVPLAELPQRCRLRAVTRRDLAERVAVHRDAWVGSSWTLERYEALRAAAPYDESLDLVVEDVTDGRFLACCICWADAVSGSGHFEPVGARPAARGRGLTRELIREGFRRLAARGLAAAYTETPGFNAPAQALYLSSGFTPRGKRRTFIKRVDE